MSDKEDNRHDRRSSRSRSMSAGEARSPKREDSPRSGKEDRGRSRSRSRSRKSEGRSRHSGPRSTSRSRSRSRGRDRWHYSRSRSRSRSPYRRRRSRHSRSRSRSRSGGYGGHERRRSHYRSHSRSPMSSRRRHNGDRENPKTGKCLGVFGLSLYTQERDLRDHFSKYGPIDEVQVVYDHQTGRSRGFGFIYMRNTEDACEAREKAPGSEIDGRKIRVDFSITKRAHTPTPGIYLGKPTSRGYGGYSRRSPSPYNSYRSGGSRGGGRYSRSRSRSYTPPRRY